jgi:putative tricarboxylic transport membrane protein
MGAIPSVIRLLAGVALATALTGAVAQDWSPQKNVEIVVSTAPGGSNDKTARTLERILVVNKLVNATITVVNKPGGVAQIYLNQRPSDGHTLMVGTPGLLTNHILGRSSISHADVTPIASLFNDYTTFAVNAASQIRAGSDLVTHLKKDPKSLPIGLAGTIGSLQYIPAALLMKAVGGDHRDLKVVSYKGSADAVVSLLGGHIDLVTTAAGNAAPHIATGKMRVLAVAAPKRLGGVLADIPTWKEQGVDLVWSGWRAIIARKGLSASQIAYWEAILHKATATKEWKDDLEKNYWSDDFVTGAQFRKDLEKDYADAKSVLTELGLAKQ